MSSTPLPPAGVPYVVDPNYISYKSQEQAQSYIAVAFLTLGLYEYLLTFQDEIEYIWKRKMHFLSFLLIAVRYSTIVLSIFNFFLVDFLVRTDGIRYYGSQTLYLASTRVQQFGNPIVISAADCILAIRIWALYQQNNFLFVFLFFLIIIQAAISHVPYSFLVLPMTTHSLFYRMTLQFQLPVETYVPYLVTAVVMFCLSSSRCIQSIRQSNSRYMPVTTMFLRDGVYWFLCTLIVLILQMAFLCRDGFEAISSLLVLVFVILLSTPMICDFTHILVNRTYNIVSSRVLIGMRALETNLKQDKEQASQQLTTLAFRSAAQSEEQTVSQY